MRDEKRGLTCLREISVLYEYTKIPVGPKWLYWRNEPRALGEWAEWMYWIKYINTLNWRHWQTELSVLAEWALNTGSLDWVSWRTNCVFGPNRLLRTWNEYPDGLNWVSWRTEQRVLRKWTEYHEEMDLLSWWREFRILTNWTDNHGGLKRVYWQAGLNIPTVQIEVTNEFSNKHYRVRYLSGLNNYTT